MVWGAILYGGRSNLIFYDEKMSNIWYIVNFEILNLSLVVKIFDPLLSKKRKVSQLSIVVDCGW